MKDDQFVANGARKKILVCAESLRINETSSGIVTSTFISMLRDNGYRVDVLSQKNFSYEITWLEGVQLYLFEPIDTKSSWIRRIPKLRAVFPLMERVSPMLNPAIRQWRDEIDSTLKREKYDLIIALGSGAQFFPHFALAALKPDIKWIANFHDPFPMHAYPVPYRHKKGVYGWLLEFHVHRLMKYAWKICFPSEYLMNSMQEYYPEIISKSFVIPHIGTRLNALPELADDNKFQLAKGKINILHAGTLLGPRDPSFLLAAIKELHFENIGFAETVNFVFLGKVSRELKAEVAATSLPNVLFFDGRISYKKSLDVIQEADGLMVIEAINDFSPFMPGKLADISFFEKPILAFTCKNSEVLRLLGNDYPYYSALNDIQSIKKAISKLVDDLQSKSVNLDPVLSLKEYCSSKRNGVLINDYLFH